MKLKPGWLAEQLEHEKGTRNPNGKVGRKGALGWRFCVKCGLVYLNNEVTQKAIKQSCESDME